MSLYKTLSRLPVKYPGNNPFACSLLLRFLLLIALIAFQAAIVSAQVPPMPTGVTATTGHAQSLVKWNAVAGATSYSLFRGTTPGGEGGTAYQTGISSPTFTDISLTNGQPYYYQVVAVNGSGSSPRSAEASAVPNIHVNCGGTSYTDANGVFYAADTGFTGGTTITTGTNIAGTNDQPLYQNQRAASVGSSFTYSFTLPNGSYSVTLLFADIQSTATGQNKFTIFVVGRQVATGVDIFALAGGANKAFSLTYPANIRGNNTGTLTVQLTPTTGSAALAGIVVSPPPAAPAAYIPFPPHSEDFVAMDSAAGSTGSGPASSMMVNLASFTAVNRPGADISAYNPLGPSPIFARTYYGGIVRSATHSCAPEFPQSPGWTDNYDVQVTSATPTAWGTLTLNYGNGASETFTPTVTGGSATFTHPTGAPYVVSGVPSGTVGQWTSITLTMKDHSQHTFTPAAVSSGNTAYLLTRITNLVGHFITINRDTLANKYRVLSIQNDAVSPVTLLQFNYNGPLLTSVQDIASPNLTERRQVNYTYATVNALTEVSQIGAIGSTPPKRWGYLLQKINGIYYVEGVRLPNPANPGSTTNYWAFYYNDSNGNARGFVDSFGNQHTYMPTSGGAEVSVYSHGTTDNLALRYVQKVNANNLSSGFTDYKGKNATLTYGDPNNPNLPTASANRNNQQNSVTYDQFQNVLTSQNNRGDVVTNGYDTGSFVLGNLISVQETHQTGGSTDATRIGSQFAYYGTSDGALNGLLKSATTPMPGSISPSSLTVTTNYTYTLPTTTTPGGNVATITRPNANGTQTVTFNYTNAAPPGQSAYSQTEALGKPLTVTVSGPDANGATTIQATYFKYDGRGNVRAVIDAEGRETNYFYNRANQITQVQYPATNETGTGRTTVINTYQYPGGPVANVTLSNEAGTPVRQVNYTYTAEGKIATITGSTQPARYQYNATGQVTTVFDGNNRGTYYFYDPLGSLMQMQYPKSGAPVRPSLLAGSFDSLTYTYDDDQNLLTKTDGRGLVTTYTRNDPASLVTQVAYSNLPAGVTSIPNISYTYDPFGRLATRNDGITGNAATPKTYSYDDLDNPLTITTNFVGGPQNQAIQYVYNSDGSRSQMLTPVGTYSYQMDGVGRLTRAGFPWTGGSVTHTYRDNGWLSSSATSRFRCSYEYNARGLIGSLLNVNTFTGNTVSNFTGMTYDASGNRLRMTAFVPNENSAQDASRSVMFSYDEINLRDVLTQEVSTATGGNNVYNQNYTNLFAYDAAFNATTFRGASIAYNTDNQRTTAGTGGAFSYDGNGNPTTYQGATFSFDPEDRLTTFATAGFSARYDTDGRRAYRTTNGRTVWFLYDEAGDSNTPLIEEVFSSGTASVDGAVGMGADGVRMRYYPLRNNQRIWSYVYDPLGNLVNRVNNESNASPFFDDIYSNAVFDAYGMGKEMQASAGQIPPIIRDAVGFGGQFGYYTDIETGLVCLSHRYYDPGTGRFVNRNPIGYQGGINLYAFAGGNPVNESDPTGTQEGGATATGSRGLREQLMKVKELRESIRTRTWQQAVGLIPAKQWRPRNWQVIQPWWRHFESDIFQMSGSGGGRGGTPTNRPIPLGVKEPVTSPLLGF